MSRPLPTVAALLMCCRHRLLDAAQQQGRAASRASRCRQPARDRASARDSAEQRTASTIQGNALDCDQRPAGERTVRLRDARFGRIVDTQYTDQSGMFAFKSIEPGSYIVEIMANDESILAASQLLNVDARRGRARRSSSCRSAFRRSRS